MNKTMKHGALLLSLLSCGLMRGTTSEFRSPLSVIRGQMHYVLAPIHETWWANAMDYCEDKDHYPWFIETWSAYFCRSAHESFFDGCDCDNNTTKTVSLSTLWFGKESFRGEEAFANGIITDPEILRRNPFLSFARITPRFDYNEQGSVFGLHVERRFGDDGKWRVGGRVSIPFHVIEIEQNNTCSLEETLEDVFSIQLVNVLGVNNQVLQRPFGDFAARLDFLSALQRQIVRNGEVQFQPFVEYRTGGPANETSMAGVNQVTGDTADAQTAVVYAIRRDDGTLPPQPFRKRANQVGGPIAADGSVSSDISFFLTNTNYLDGLAQNRDAQSRLFIVPRQEDNGNNLVDGANTISENLTDLLLFLDDAETATEFFREQCIDFCAHFRDAAVGDTDLEAYFGYGPGDWFVNLVAGVRFPTGTKEKCASQIFFQSTGHKRHWELMFRAEGGWQPYNWFGFRLDASWHHAFERSEKRAAPFKGASVKNIGPEIEVDVSWDYFIVHADFDFFHPCNPDLGTVFGYELFAKLDDHVDLCNKTAQDFFGRERELDPEILENCTNSMTHKFRGEVFHRWNYGEIFAGASHIIAGRNAMQETEAHIGFACHF